MSVVANRYSRRRNSMPIIICILVVMSLGGCSINGQEVESEQSVDQSSESGKVEGPQFTVSEESSPFEPYYAAFEQLDGEDETYAKAALNWRKEFEATIAECMKKQGFEYYPPEPKETAEISLDRNDVLRIPYLPDSKEEVANAGYGKDDQASDDVTQWAEDPNTLYFKTLNPSAQESYQHALGTRITDDQTEELISETGCTPEAKNKHPRPEVPFVQADEFMPLLNRMGLVAGVELEDEPRVRALNEEWAMCMANAGYEFSRSDVEGMERTPSPMDAGILANNTAPDGSTFRAAPDEGVAMEDVPWEQRALVGSAVEVQIALDDFDCRESTNYVHRLTAIRNEQEKVFLRNNQEQLDELLRAVERK